MVLIYSQLFLKVATRLAAAIGVGSDNYLKISEGILKAKVSAEQREAFVFKNKVTLDICSHELVIEYTGEHSDQDWEFTFESNDFSVNGYLSMDTCGSVVLKIFTKEYMKVEI